MRRQEIATIQTAPTSLPRESSKATGRILDAVRALPHSRNQILLSKLNLHSRKQNRRRALSNRNGPVRSSLKAVRSSRRPGPSNPALATTARLSQPGALSSRRPVRSNLRPGRSNLRPVHSSLRPGHSNPALATTARLSQTGDRSSLKPVRSNLKPVHSSRRPGLTGGSIAHLRMPVRSVRRRGLNSHASSLATARLLHTTLPAASMMSIRSTITATGFTVCRLAIA